MIWKIPPKIKIYEALGCIGDNRIKVDGNTAKIFSSSKGKFYSIEYDGKDAIICNDNGSYYIGYLGYPAIAFLMFKGMINYESKYAEALKGIAWKEINVMFKNDFIKTETYVLDVLVERGFSREETINEVNKIFEQVNSLKLKLLGEKTKPPEGY